MGLVWVGVVLVVAGVGWYAVECWLWPFEKCEHCEGGKVTSPNGKNWRQCKRCKASGGRLRIGRRIYNHFHHQRKASR